MDSFEIAERKRQARGRLRSQRARVGRLRKRAIAVSLVCFALLWGAVFVQMATGNDPALGSAAASAGAAAQESSSSEEERQRRRSSQSTTSATSAAASGSPPLEDEETEAGSEAEATVEVEPEALTTRQS